MILACKQGVRPEVADEGYAGPAELPTSRADEAFVRSCFCIISSFPGRPRFVMHPPSAFLKTLYTFVNRWPPGILFCTQTLPFWASTLVGFKVWCKVSLYRLLHIRMHIRHGKSAQNRGPQHICVRDQSHVRSVVWTGLRRKCSKNSSLFQFAVF